jgi:hypothetical protein
MSLLVTLLVGKHAGVVIILFCCCAWLGIQYLGYFEFSLAGRLMHPRTLRRNLDAQIRLHSLEQEIAAAVTVDKCWDAIRKASEAFGFSQVSMYMRNVIYEQHLQVDGNDVPNLGIGGGQEGVDCWTVQIPLSRTEFIRLSHGFRSPLPTSIVAPFADLLRQSMESKLASLQPQPERVQRTRHAEVAAS